jgi:DivIVA domain-containing protein
MDRVLLLLVVALTVAAVVFGVTVLVTGRDPGLVPAEPDGRAVPLPVSRPLRESDIDEIRFDTALRGYRMAQVDQALRRAAYDIGYKSELIGVLEAEVTALREGRLADADALRRTREQAAAAAQTQDADPTPAVAGPSSSDPANSGSSTTGEERRDAARDLGARSPVDELSPGGPAEAASRRDPTAWPEPA